MNKKWELRARQEGAKYFDEDYDSLPNKDKYKHEMYLGTGFWWFRKYNKEIRIFTNQIASTEYLYCLLRKDSIATIYYNSISSQVNERELLDYFNNTGVKFVKIDFTPSQSYHYYTTNGKLIEYSTLILASNNTIIFDKKNFGLKCDSEGDRQVYRIKDKKEYENISSKLNELL